MADHPNVQRVRDAYEAFGKGDLDTLGKMFDPGVVYHVGGQSPITGDYKGQDEVFGLFGKLFELSGGTLKLEVHDVLANDEHGVALVGMTAKRDDKSIDMNYTHVFHLKDGNVSEFWGFEEDQRRSDEFWS